MKTFSICPSYLKLNNPICFINEKQAFKSGSVMLLITSLTILLLFACYYFILFSSGKSFRRLWSLNVLLHRNSLSRENYNFSLFKAESNLINPIFFDYFSSDFTKAWILWYTLADKTSSFLYNLMHSSAKSYLLLKIA